MVEGLIQTMVLVRHDSPQAITPQPSTLGRINPISTSILCSGQSFLPRLHIV